jgi:hypothetical protein
MLLLAVPLPLRLYICWRWFLVWFGWFLASDSAGAWNDTILSKRRILELYYTHTKSDDDDELLDYPRLCQEELGNELVSTFQVHWTIQVLLADSTLAPAVPLLTVPQKLHSK